MVLILAGISITLNFLNQNFEKELLLQKEYLRTSNYNAGVCETNLNSCEATMEMYLYKTYESNDTGYAQAMAYCDKNILLIDIDRQEYWQALESFNHEWQHCKWGEHYPQARLEVNRTMKYYIGEPVREE